MMNFGGETGESQQGVVGVQMNGNSAQKHVKEDFLLYTYCGTQFY